VTGLFLIVMVLILGRIFHLRRQIILSAVGALWVVMILLQLLAPASNVALWFGGSAAGWLVLGAVVAIIALYRRVLGHLHTRAKPQDRPAGFDASLSEPELDRYARHLILPQLGGAGQVRLKSSRVLIVGAGGLGSPLCLYLAAAGVGRITLADDDVV